MREDHHIMAELDRLFEAILAHAVALDGKATPAEEILISYRIVISASMSREEIVVACYL